MTCSPLPQVTKASEVHADELEQSAQYKYPSMTKTLGGFKLKVKEGEFTSNQIIVILGENGTGKSTFIQMLVCVIFCHVIHCLTQSVYVVTMWFIVGGAYCMKIFTGWSHEA